jgi:putative transposase
VQGGALWVMAGLPCRVSKENLLWIQTFNTIEELRLALLQVKEFYNRQRLIERHPSRTPAQIREKQLNSMQQAA